MLSLLAEARGGGFPWYHGLEKDLRKELPLMVECYRSSHGRFKRALVPGSWDTPKGNYGADTKLICLWVSVMLPSLFRGHKSSTCGIIRAQLPLYYPLVSKDCRLLEVEDGEPLLVTCTAITIKIKILEY